MTKVSLTKWKRLLNYLKGIDTALTVDGIPTTVEADYVFSQYESSLSNGAEIDSGWIDMGGADKYQFEGVSGVPGFDLVIESSNVSGGGEADITSNTPINTTFHLFNVIARQRYIRFRWQNNTGGATTASLSIKKTFGSSDKLSVFAADRDWETNEMLY